MEFTMFKADSTQVINVYGKGIEVQYWVKHKPDGKFIKRMYAEVNGYIFTEHEGYYKKSGRGGVKNREEVMSMLRAADQFIHDSGYFFW